MNKPDTTNHSTTEADDFAFPLPAPIVLGTAATQAVAGGIIRPGLCTTCGLMHPVADVNF